VLARHGGPYGTARIAYCDWWRCCTKISTLNIYAVILRRNRERE